MDKKKKSGAENRKRKAAKDLERAKQKGQMEKFLKKVESEVEKVDLQSDEDDENKNTKEVKRD